MKDELTALREEVARLRERVAVLEARPTYHPPAQVVGPASPGHGQPWPPATTPAQPYRVIPMMEPPYYVGDAPGWWLHGPTAVSSSAGNLGPIMNG